MLSPTGRRESMCFYLRLSWALTRNLASRLCRDLRDSAALAKRRLLYRLRASLEGYDDVGLQDSSLEDLLIDDIQDIGADLDSNNWFINADRKTAEDLVLTGGEGCFLMRKSVRYPLTLTLLHQTRAFNIPVRRREDGRIALGSWKQHERSTEAGVVAPKALCGIIYDQVETFESVEDLVGYYSREELILFRGGERAGKVVLSSPPAGEQVERNSQNKCHHVMVHVPQ